MCKMDVERFTAQHDVWERFIFGWRDGGGGGTESPSRESKDEATVDGTDSNHRRRLEELPSVRFSIQYDWE